MVRKRSAGVYRRRDSSHEPLSQFDRIDRVIRLGGLAGALLVGGAAIASASRAARIGDGSGAGTESASATALEAPGARDANLAGARCPGGRRPPARVAIGRGLRRRRRRPTRSHKRFEIRLGAAGGGAPLSIRRRSGTSRPARTRPASTSTCCPARRRTSSFTRARSPPERGHQPDARHRRVRPQGALVVRRPAGALRARGHELQPRRRGRLEQGGPDPQAGADRSLRVGGDLPPQWDSSGGTGARELGLFRDFTVKFTMEVKRFPTQFPPRSTECVPK